MRKTWLWSKRLVVYPVLVLIGLLIVAILGARLLNTPTHDRDWAVDQAVLPYTELFDGGVLVSNIRNFTYRSVDDYDISYYDKTFYLDDLVNVYYIVEPFSGIPGSAHTFLSFEFEGDEFLAVSVEIRKEKGESFHPVKGLFSQYEVMYVLADEKDVVKLRSNYRKDDVYVYPAKTTKEKMQQLFLSVIYRVNELYEKPEFYNTITNTCTTNIVSHVNEVSPGKVPWLRLAVLFPEYSDKLAYELGLIDTEFSFEEAREYFHINERALKYADGEDFSVRIRTAE